MKLRQLLSWRFSLIFCHRWLAAAIAMPGHDYTELRWLTAYDDYYYQTLDTFDLGLPRTVRTLPVLRLKYDERSVGEVRMANGRERNARVAPDQGPVPRK